MALLAYAHLTLISESQPGNENCSPFTFLHYPQCQSSFFIPIVFVKKAEGGTQEV